MPRAIRNGARGAVRQRVSRVVDARACDFRSDDAQFADTVGRASHVISACRGTVALRRATSHFSAGRPTGVTYPGGSGQSVTRTFDSAGHLATITDWNNNTTKFGYGHDSQLLTTTYPNGTKVASTYDNAGQLSATALTGTAGATLAALGFTRDNSGQLATQTPTGLPDGPQTFTYSDREQLATVSTGAATSQYSADVANNPILVGGSQQAFDAAGQLCWSSASVVAN
ncbi:MAG: putative NocE [Amycolatopsis sp.]|nr:putative NocE [Amycolatopsis sp.]